jgi:cytochrome c-type biogenesis protein CcmH
MTARAVAVLVGAGWALALAGGPVVSASGFAGGLRADPAQAASSVADSALEAQVRRVASELRCPVCQGLSIQDSPSELAQEMRNLIRERLRAGDTPEQVRAYFVSRYGEWVLLEPEPRGLNLAVWAGPVLLLLGGVLFVLSRVRRWTRGPEAAPEAVDEAALARVREELERLEEAEAKRD